MYSAMSVRPPSATELFRRRETMRWAIRDIAADDPSTASPAQTMGCIEGIQLTIFVELANKLVIDEVRHRYTQHARIMEGDHSLHLCQRSQ